MRQQEKAEHCGVRDLVVKRLTMQMEECRINTDIVPREREKNHVLLLHTFFILKGNLKNCEVNILVCRCMYLPLGVRHCNSLKIHTASPVAWMTSALDRTF